MAHTIPVRKHQIRKTDFLCVRIVVISSNLLPFIKYSQLVKSISAHYLNKVVNISLYDKKSKKIRVTKSRCRVPRITTAALILFSNYSRVLSVHTWIVSFEAWFTNGLVLHIVQAGLAWSSSSPSAYIHQRGWTTTVQQKVYPLLGISHIHCLSTLRNCDSFDVVLPKHLW